MISTRPCLGAASLPVEQRLRCTSKLRIQNVRNGCPFCHWLDPKIGHPKISNLICWLHRILAEVGSLPHPTASELPTFNSNTSILGVERHNKTQTRELSAAKTIKGYEVTAYARVSTCISMIYVDNIVYVALPGKLPACSLINFRSVIALSMNDGRPPIAGYPIDEDH